MALADKRVSERRVGASGEGCVVRYHKRYAMLQVIVFLVAVGAFIGLIVRQNLERERLDMASHGHRFGQQVLVLESEFTQLQLGIIRLRMNADEALFQSRENAVPMHDLFRFLKATPDGQAFHLDEAGPPYSKERIGNLTGDGSLTGRSADSMRELSMVLRLCGACDRLAQVLPNLAWIYYYSKDNFALYYPWCLSKETRFEKEAYKTTAWTLGLPENNPQRQPYWTETYFDAVGKGLMVSCLAPVYEGERFLGVVGGDLSVNHLNDIIRSLELRPLGTFVVYDAFGNVLAAPGLIAAADKQITKLTAVLPTELAANTEVLARIPPGEFQRVHGWRVVRQGFAKTPFTALYFEPRPSRVHLLIGNVGYGAFFLLGGVMALLILSLVVSHWWFVRPSEILVQHILTKSEGGEPRRVRWIPQAWKPWFAAITRVFDEKAALTANLETRNRELRDEVNERLRGEAVLRESEKRFRTILESVSLVGVLLDRDGRITLCNDFLLALTGWQRDAVMNQNWFNLFLPLDCRDEIRHGIFLKAIGSGELPVHFENEIVTQAGERRLIAWNNIVLRDQAGAVVGVASIGEDITARKQAEAALRQRDRDLQQRNDELMRFNYTVSHDLKSPLVTISAFLGYLEQDLRKSDPTALARDLAHIHNAADKMAKLLDELLVLSRIGRQQNPPEDVPFQAVVAEALALVAGQITTRGVNVEVAATSLVLHGDRVRLVELFQNLVDNACKFTGDQSAPQIEIGAVEAADGSPVFYVRDNGIGVEPRYQEKLFGLFEKLDPNSAGTGIGLALVKRIVEVHGGRIWVESEGLGKGTTFRFTLAPGNPTMEHT